MNKPDNDAKFTVDLEHASQLTFAERLLLKLNSSDILEIHYFAAGEKIAERGTCPEFGHVIIAGEVIARGQFGSYAFGPGSVFGVAEGLSETGYAWDIVAKNLVTTRAIPIKRSLSQLRSLNVGLLGICRITVMRILGLTKSPESLS